MATKILLDTDIGSDIDDAVCLAYLLAQPECELLGITTVSGEPEKRAMLCSALCTEAGVDVPIFPGAPRPILGKQHQPYAPQAEALSNWKHETDFPRAHALGFMRNTIRDNPGDVVLLAIGPITNVALLFAMDPELPSLLKGLVLMCGVFVKSVGIRSIEWNALCDPYAAAVVYNSSVAMYRTVSLDVTTEVVMNADEVRERFGLGLLKPVKDFTEVWFKERPEVMFHDPLAACFLNSCLRHSESVRMANMAPVINTRGPLFVHPEGVVKRTTFHVMEMYANRLHPNIVDVWVDSEALDRPALTAETIRIMAGGAARRTGNGSGEVPMPALDVVATCDDAARKWSVAIVNRHRTNEITAAISLGRTAISGDREAVVLSGPDADSYNDVQAPERVAPEHRKQRSADGETTFPPHSLTIVQFETM
jgi:inosine-uridine nucleoside N-ribohydrolase